MNNANRKQIVKSLCEAVDFLVEAIGSGRLGFDYAVKEYVEKHDNALSKVLKEYVQALGMGTETQRNPNAEEESRLMKIRREVLLKVAKELDVPEVTSFVSAVLESQDKHISLLKTLQGQAEQLHKTIAED
jgi:tight adherence protein C